MRMSVVAIGLLLLTHTATAAIEYEFRQSSRSDIESIQTGEFTGRAVIDGDRVRVDFTGGNAYTPGTYMISTNGSRSLIFVDPMRRSYTEVNSAAVASALGGSNISVSGFQSDVLKLDDHIVIAGLPTDHYRLTLKYDITIKFGTIPLKQAVVTVVDKWTTAIFGDIADSFLSGGGVHTGNADLDAIIDAETMKIKGFPLRQTMQIATTKTFAQPAASELKLNPTRRQSRELVITSIRKTDAHPSLFTVPAAYQKASPKRDERDQSPLHMLSMEPAGK